MLLKRGLVILKSEGTTSLNKMSKKARQTPYKNDSTESL